MIKTFLILILFLSNSFCDSDNLNLEFVSNNPKVEDLKIVQSYPFNEGQNISKIPPKASKKPITYTENELKYIEELRQISMEEFDKADEEEKEKNQKVNIETKNESDTQTKKQQVSQETIIPNTKINIEKNKVETNQPKIQTKKVIGEKEVQNPSSNISSYEQIIVEVDSQTNIMSLKAKINNEIKEIKTFKVSTGKIGIEKPNGNGLVTKISLNPTWYPTDDTIKSFRKKGIFLPNIVPAGSKYNYMGAAKINLSHEVNGKSTYRIHGTLNEKTIGTNESAGCIRMKNSEVVQLATLMNDFAKLKSINEIKVILK